jgi:phage baseplate assembly protein W
MGTTSLAQTTTLKGLGLPALRGAGGYFAVKNRYDVAWSDLMIALFTPIGGRAFDRSFGSGLHHVLFSPVTVAVDQLANYTVKQAAALWCPHVTVIDIQVKVDGKAIQLGIKFALTDDLSRPDFRAVQINKSSVIQLLQAANNG